MIKKWITRLPVPVLVVLVLFLIITPALAVYYLTAIPVLVEVVPGLQEVVFYGPPNYDVPTAGLQFAVFQRGTSQDMTLKVVNAGVEPLDLQLTTSPQAISWAAVTLEPADLGTLAAGEYAYFTLTIDVPLTTELGNYTFEIVPYVP